jgi:hypothetical protein
MTPKTRGGEAMPRFKVVLHRDGQRVVVSYGWSATLGFFVTVIRSGTKILDYDGLSPGYRGLPGLLDALVEAGVFTREAVEEALTALMVVDDPESIDRDELRTVAKIVFNAKTAAGE